jgi:hypothetical protein
MSRKAFIFFRKMQNFSMIFLSFSVVFPPNPGCGASVYGEVVGKVIKYEWLLDTTYTHTQEVSREAFEATVSFHVR